MDPEPDKEVRFVRLRWLGAAPHWLYPTLLRQNSPR
jgi:hypothetical protein